MVFGSCIQDEPEPENWGVEEEAVATLPFCNWSWGSCWYFNDNLDVERTWLHHWFLLIVELYNQFPKFYSIKSSVTKQDVLDAYVAVSNGIVTTPV